MKHFHLHQKPICSFLFLTNLIWVLLGSQLQFLDRLGEGGAGAFVADGGVVFFKFFSLQCFLFFVKTEEMCLTTFFPVSLVFFG